MMHSKIVIDAAVPYIRGVFEPYFKEVIYAPGAAIDASMVADRLAQLAREVNIPEMVQMMKSVVPEYISNNSKFEEYDKTKK